MKNTNKTVQNSESAHGLPKEVTIAVLAALLALAAFIWISVSGRQAEEKSGLGLGLQTERQGAADNVSARAEAGDAEAQYRIAHDYIRKNDWANAVPWLEKAAAQGHGKAQNNLGVAYVQGLGVAKDNAKACELFKSAYQQLKDAKTADNLGMCLDERHTASGYAEAFEYFQIAAEKGDSHAQNALAQMYEKGEGTKMDKEKAIYWYRQAIIQNGNVESAYALGLMYARNEGFPKNKSNSTAAYMLLKSAWIKAAGRERQRLAEANLPKLLEELEANMPKEIKAQALEIEKFIKNHQMKDVLSRLEKLPFISPQEEEKALEPLAF